MSSLAYSLGSERWRNEWTMALITQKEAVNLRKELANVRRENANMTRKAAFKNAAKRAAQPKISGNGQKLVSAAPAAYGSEMRSDFNFFRPAGKFRDALGVRGTEWIGPVTVPANAVAGQVLRNDYVQPAEFGDSRLALFGQMYEKFRFRRLRYRFIPAVGSTQPGSLLLAYDRDISDPTPPPGAQAIRQFMSWADSVQGNAWMNHTLTAQLECPDAGYYTDESVGGDERLCYQGQFYVAVVNPFGNAADLVIGNMVLEYDLELFVPQLQARVPTAHIDNTGATKPAAGDAFQQYIKDAAGVIKTAATVLSYVPSFANPGSYQAKIKLAEGLYRLVNTINTLAASGTNTVLKPPKIELIEETCPAPAPQPQVRTLNTADGLAGENGTCMWDGLLDIPKGGAYVSQDFSVVTDSTLGGSSMTLNKLGPYLADLTSIF